MRKLLLTISLFLLGAGCNQTLGGATILFPAQGGTGTSTASSADVGKALTVNSVSPLTFSFSSVVSSGYFTATSSDAVPLRANDVNGISLLTIASSSIVAESFGGTDVTLNGLAVLTLGDNAGEAGAIRLKSGLTNTGGFFVDRNATAIGAQVSGGGFDVGDGTVSSSLNATRLIVTAGTSNKGGKFSSDVSGNVSASGTLQTFGLATVPGFISSASSSVASNLNVAGTVSVSGTLAINNNLFSTGAPTDFKVLPLRLQNQTGTNFFNIAVSPAGTTPEFSFLPGAATSGNAATYGMPVGSYSGITNEVSLFGLNGSGVSGVGAGNTLSYNTANAPTDEREVRIRAMPLASDSGAQTVKRAATLVIDEAPSAGTRMSIVSSTALLIDNQTSGTASSSYGMFVKQPTGGSVTSTAAYFQGDTFFQGNVTTTGAEITMSGLSAPSITDDIVCFDTRAATFGQLSHQVTNCTVVSSARFKEHIQSMSPQALLKETIALRMVMFDFRERDLNGNNQIPSHGVNGGGKESIGFIAEEVALIDPQLVVYVDTYTKADLEFEQAYYPKAILYKNDKVLIPQTVDYARISILLTGALQAEDLRITALENTLENKGFIHWLTHLF